MSRSHVALDSLSVLYTFLYCRYSCCQAKIPQIPQRKQTQKQRYRQTVQVNILHICTVSLLLPVGLILLLQPSELCLTMNFYPFAVLE